MSESEDHNAKLREIGRTLRERRGHHFDDVRFSDAEYERRYRKVREEMYARDLDCLVIYGSSAHTDSNQQSIRYLSGYVDQISAYIVFPYEGEPVLFPDLYGHVPDAFMMAHEGIDVHWGTYEMARPVVERVRELGYAEADIGLVGTVGRGTQLPADHLDLLERELPNAAFEYATDVLNRVCIEKSAEEVEALRDGARLTDMALEGLVEATKPGATERDLKKAVMTPFLDQGEYMFQLIGSTSMHDPDMPYPFEHQSSREIQQGDLVVTEISAKGLQGYSGQILRPIAVGEEPTEEFQWLYDIAEDIFWDVFDVLEPGNTTEDVLDAATPHIEDNDLTIHAPIIHGWGLGLQYQPLVGTRNEGAMANAPFTFEEGHMVVIEPNPVTKDQLKGMFLGELVHITEEGAERLHDYPMEFIQV